MSYATVAQLREYLDQVTTGAAMDAKLGAVLGRAHAIVDGALGIVFAEYGEAADRDVRAASNPGCYLQLPAHKPGSVVAVAEVGGRGTSAESTDPVTEFLEEDDGRLYCDGGWDANAWYRVRAEWGYGPAPDDVIQVELETAVTLWQQRGGQIPAEVGAEGGAVRYPRALTWAQRNTLDNARLRALGGPTFA